MTSILGKHISVVRPSACRQHSVYCDERPKAKYDTKPITNEGNTGKVDAISIKLKTGEVKSIKIGNHLDVMEAFGHKPSEVEQTGWRLASGRYIWR